MPKVSFLFCRAQRRKFIFVESIEGERPTRIVNKAVEGTRLLHAVKGVEPGVVAVRLLSCFYRGCEDNTSCENSAYSQPWQTRSLKMAVPVSYSAPPEVYPTYAEVQQYEQSTAQSATELFKSLEGRYMYAMLTVYLFSLLFTLFHK